MKNISIRAALLASFLVAGILPVAIISVFIGQKSGAALVERSKEQLEAVRSSRQKHVEGYLSLVSDHISTVANDLMTVEAMEALSESFDQLPEIINSNDKSLDDMRQKLATYYSGEFGREFLDKTGESVNALSLMPRDTAAVVAQYKYIAENPFPLGEKDQLERSANSVQYDQVHERYHAVYRDMLERFGYYDVFLIEPSDGRIVYSVFKELDYATSLFSGPYRNTNFARLTRRTLSSPAGRSVMEDFEFYRPSYDAPAAFVGAPIYKGIKLIGVLVFQMPVDRINEIMLNSDGLGATGAAALVGEDGRYRTQSRFNDGASILVDEYPQEVIRPAFEGATGSDQVEIDGENYLSSFAPFEAEGLNWAFVATISAGEALAAVSTLNRLTFWGGLIAALFVAAFSIYLASWVRKKLGAEPAEIQQLALAIGAGDLSAGGDAEGRVGAYESLLRMRDKLRETLQSAIDIAGEVQIGSRELSDGNMGLSERTEQQAANLEETASSTEQLTSTVRQNADNAKSANALASETQSRASSSGEVAMRAVAAMEDISSASEKIADIIGVIDEIAFQTNLLALNAAVEAARAGEQGRGFAVVASEVRQLAGRSASAAREIKDLIEDSVSKVHNGTTLVQESGDELRAIVDSISRLSVLVGEITTASEEQSVGIDQINQALIHMDSVTQQNAALVEQAAATSKSMSDQASDLSACIGYFSSDTGPAGPAATGTMPRVPSLSHASGAHHGSSAFEPKAANAEQRPDRGEMAPPAPKAAAAGSEMWEEF